MLPDHLVWQWPLLRLVRKGIARETEIRQNWSIQRVLDYNDLLDLEDEYEVKMASVRAEQLREANSGR